MNATHILKEAGVEKRDSLLVRCKLIELGWVMIYKVCEQVESELSLLEKEEEAFLAYIDHTFPPGHVHWSSGFMPTESFV